MTYGRYDQHSLEVSRQIMAIMDTLPELKGGRCQLQARIQIAVNDALEKSAQNHKPTQWAYDQACTALREHRQRADRAENERDLWRQEAERAEQQATSLAERLQYLTAFAYGLEAYKEQEAGENMAPGNEYYYIDNVNDIIDFMALPAPSPEELHDMIGTICAMHPDRNSAKSDLQIALECKAREIEENGAVERGES